MYGTNSLAVLGVEETQAPSPQTCEELQTEYRRFLKLSKTRSGERAKRAAANAAKLKAEYDACIAARGGITVPGVPVTPGTGGSAWIPTVIPGEAVPYGMSPDAVAMGPLPEQRGLLPGGWMTWAAIAGLGLFAWFTLKK